MENRNEWVNVKDGLPDKDCRVLIYDNNDPLREFSVKICFFEADTKTFTYYEDDWAEVKPTHWKYIYLPNNKLVL